MGMVFGVILAGGVGNRMGNLERPKQYITVGDKPIIIHTMQKFLENEEFEHLIVPCPKVWIEHTNSLMKKYFPEKKEHITVLEGGDTRNETIMNAIAFIEQTYGLDEETLIVTHDSVRPFLTERIIRENIEYGKKYGAADTVIPSTDTIVVSEDGAVISDIPDRKRMYQGQTPQTFRAKRLRDLYYSLTEEEKEILTDASKIYVIKGEKVYLVNGEVSNIKITYPYDLRVAEILVKNMASEKRTVKN